MFNSKILYPVVNSLLIFSACLQIEAAVPSMRVLLQPAVAAAKKVTLKKAAGAALVTAFVGVGARRYAKSEAGKKNIAAVRSKYNRDIAPVIKNIRPTVVVGAGIGSYLLYKGYKNLLLLQNPPPPKKLVKILSGLVAACGGGYLLGMELVRAVDLARISGNSSTVRNSITLKDYKGSLPEPVSDFYDEFLNPEKHKKMMASGELIPPAGFLFYGPPGTGKTYLAQALAGSLGIPYDSINISEILGKWLGESEGNVTRRFYNLRRVICSDPKNNPKKMGILFIDELDALGATRADSTWVGGSKVLQTLLTLIDGFNKYEGHILVIGATNRLDMVDKALQRPGRLKPIEIPALDEAGCRLLLDYYLKKYNYEYQAADFEDQRNATLNLIARMAYTCGKNTPVFFKELCESARRRSARLGLDCLTDVILREVATAECPGYRQLVDQERIRLADILDNAVDVD